MDGMDWFNRESLEGLIEGLDGKFAAMAVATYAAVEEIHTALETMERRIGSMENGISAVEDRTGAVEKQMEAVYREAVSIKKAGDGKLVILPLAAPDTHGAQGKGEDTADGN